jgi:4-amino-4-deoxy-L-arabinose transferase-like glycosyltransferase
MNREWIAQYRAELLLLGIVILAGFLNLWNIRNDGFYNPYYAAAVRSVLANPGLAFFNPFDAGGFVTVDKPPLGVWVQAASAAVFGFSNWSLVLPSVLAGLGSVILVYCIVARPFGKPAGLVAALALAITPIFDAISRNILPDGLLVFVLLLAVWVALKAARDNSLPCLLLAALLIGLGFNIKLIQAFIVVPAVLGIYLLGAGGIPGKTRLVHIGIAIMVIAVVSLSWAVAVDMVPADQRPWIGGSGDNTVMGLITHYNGLFRLQGGMYSVGGTGGAPGGGIGGLPSAPNAAGTPAGTQAIAGIGAGIPGGQAGSTNPVTLYETGSPGPLRLVNHELAGQISWLLPLALIGLLAYIRRPGSFSFEVFGDAGYFSERGLTIFAMLLWLFPGLLYFSFTSGFWHPYYLATIAPPLAALVGIGAAGLFHAYTGTGLKSWLLIAATGITGCTQLIILAYDADWAGILVPAIAFGTLGITALLVVLHLRQNAGSDRLPKIVAALAIGILFIAPFIWACTPAVYGGGDIVQVAGPQLMGRSGISTGLSAVPGLTAYLLSQRSGEQWIVATPTGMDAADLIISTGQPVMAVGGFDGPDRILTTDSLADLIHRGKIRFFLLTVSNGNVETFGNGAIFSWVSDHCTEVPASVYRGAGPVASNQGAGSPAGGSGTAAPETGPGVSRVLYDCRGSAG